MRNSMAAQLIRPVAGLFVARPTEAGAIHGMAG
jgi:hypothetical protein